ncbi:uncharacterized protein LOC110023645 isoform X2 [Phalaenopsis equestris]|uniref:uncharacterized protein LOC110023645 isoform X2 n=1 Tax=Phalaenopsis equestris TaxID=78828 RepID=UPI0009E5D1EB|nr:uncharacterized protein LOC110023645 isoform X2 [Phalaenopsis equestris]
MFVKHLLEKAKGQILQHGNMAPSSQDFQVAMHYGIPYTASILAFDAVQRLLAIGTLDGRIKIIGGDNIEGLLISLKKIPYKYLEFLDNKGFIIGVSNENDIQVWDLQCRKLSYSVQWEANITAFAVISGTYLMYVGDENGLLSVLKYDSENEKLLSMPYNIPLKPLSESLGVSIPDQQQIVGILPQPGISGTRVLIAYENGLIILWDICENCAITMRSSRDLQLKVKKEGDPFSKASNDLSNTIADEPEEKEICSICWVSNSDPILAVGYIDGDILLWDLSVSSSVKGKESGVPSKNVVKLQLASGDRRLPVIVLHWSADAKSNNDKSGQLFVYGGDDMGSEEVITVLNLVWSAGIDTIRCSSDVELNLNGSFADMILVPDAGPANHNSTAALFVLTNPGQVNVYDGAALSIMKSSDGDVQALAEKFPVVVPTIDPHITVTKLCLLPMGQNSSKALLKKAFAKRNITPTLSTSMKWPLTGGVPGEATVSEENGIDRLYIAGYQDGSIRIWDATHPILAQMLVFDDKITDIEVDGQGASVSALEFYFLNLSLVVGNEFGLVRVYKLQGGANRSNIIFVNGSKQEVRPVRQGEGFHYTAAFNLSSPIRTLQFANCGDKLAVGLESGKVAMLDLTSYTTLFQTDCLSSTSSQVISIAMEVIPQVNTMISSSMHPRPEDLKESSELLMFILTKDGHVIIVNSTSGKTLTSWSKHSKKDSAAISMYVIDGPTVSEILDEKQNVLDEHSSKGDYKNYDDFSGNKKQGIEQHSSDASSSPDLLLYPLFLLCCENSVRLYSLKSVLQGESRSCRKIKLIKHCCWSTIFKRRDGKSCGLILLYQTGDLEIRSLPNLELVGGSSLMSILRWSFKTNMEKTMSSYDNGQITMVNGSEVAFISLLACENDFRIPESLPSLHDKVLAAAADNAIALYANQKNKQDTSSRILSGLIKGLKGSRAESNSDTSDFTVRSSSDKVEDYFLKDPFLEPSPSTTNNHKVELSIDDIEIDDNRPQASSSSNVSCSSDAKKHKRKEENKEREKLFDGATNDVKPRVRTPQEILTQYKFGGDAAAAAAHAKDKLVERQEKLERLKKNTEELQSGAENFASLANELVKTMENKKWWKL